MDARVTDLWTSHRITMIDYVVPTNNSNKIYTVFLFGTAANHGDPDPGWATIVGYLELDEIQLEREGRGGSTSMQGCQPTCTPHSNTLNPDK